MNDITENIWYTDDDSKNMRMVVSAKTKHPIVWKVTKVENLQPIGTQTITFYQNYWNSHTDFIEEENGKVVGMWADYFDTNIPPTDPEIPDYAPSPISAKLSASTTFIKAGGSYKLLTINMYDKSGEDVTSEYSDATFTWTCNVENNDWTDKVTWRKCTDFDQMKLKFPSDTSQLGKILTISCTIKRGDAEIVSEPLLLNISE